MNENLNKNDRAKISRFIDGDNISINLSEKDREVWKIYNLIGDSIRNPSHKEFIPDLSDKVLEKIKIEEKKSHNIEQSFFSNLFNSLVNFLSFDNLKYAAGVSFVFFLGFSSSNIIESNINSNFVQLVSPDVVNNSVKNIYSCDFPELKNISDKISLDQLIEHHEGVSGSSSLC